MYLRSQILHASPVRPESPTKSLSLCIHDGQALQPQKWQYWVFLELRSLSQQMQFYDWCYCVQGLVSWNIGSLESNVTFLPLILIWYVWFCIYWSMATAGDSSKWHSFSISPSMSSPRPLLLCELLSLPATPDLVRLFLVSYRPSLCLRCFGLSSNPEVVYLRDETAAAPKDFFSNFLSWPPEN